MVQTRVRLIASMWSHERVHSGETVKTVQQDLARRRGIPPPPTRTILLGEQKLFLTGLRINRGQDNFDAKGLMYRSEGVYAMISR